MICSSMTARSPSARFARSRCHRSRRRAGQLLWDIGAGSGSVAIEWILTHPSLCAIAIEARPDRAARISRNAAALGVPGLHVIQGHAPEALTELATPDAIFVGGGASETGVLDAAIAALRPGGRLVANAVTLETEAELIARHSGGRRRTDTNCRLAGRGGRRQDGLAPGDASNATKMGEALIVAGIGCRRGATEKEVEAAIQAALTEVGQAQGTIGLIATSDGKGGEAGIVAAAAARRLRLVLVGPAELEAAGSRTQSSSPLVKALAGVPSVAEAAALAAGGPSAKLILPRISIGPVTCALAETEDTR